jgi:hypothetical protein
MADTRLCAAFIVPCSAIPLKSGGLRAAAVRAGAAVKIADSVPHAAMLSGNNFNTSRER